MKEWRPPWSARGLPLLCVWSSVARLFVFQSLVQKRQKLLHIKRLGQVGARTGGEQAIRLASGRIGADHNHRNMAGLDVTLQPNKDLVPRHVRQMQIQQGEKTLDDLQIG